MPVYNYIGIDSKGKRASGIIDAENERAARAKLRKMHIFPTSLGSGGSGGSRKLSLGSDIDFSKYFQKIKVQDIAVMTRQLSTLVAAGIPLVDSITALIDQTDNIKLRTILSEVREEITSGSKLSAALKRHPRVFGDLYVNMVNAGENSGALEVVLQRLSDFTEGQSKLKSKVLGAMIYPIIMSIVGVAIMVALLVFVVPKITKMLTDAEVELPLPTKLLVGASSLLSNYWYLIILFIGVLVYFIRRFLRKPSGKEWLDKKVLKLPIMGKLQRMIVISRFSRTLSTLLSSGVPLLASMDIVRNIVTNSVLRRVIEKTRDNVREGQSVAEPLKKSGEFPPIVTQMIAVGERTGDLERMLERVADAYDSQVDNTISALMSILEPVMILVMAGIVTFIVLSVLLPIMKLNQLGG